MKKKLSLNKDLLNKFKNTDVRRIMLLVGCGLLLLVISIPTKTSESSKDTGTSSETAGLSGASINDGSSDYGRSSGANGYDGGEWGSVGGYESTMESRLCELLSQVSGAGKVQVMITYSESAEDVLATIDSVTEKNVSEKDASGAQSDTYEYSSDSDYVMSEDTKGMPYVTKSISPKPLGVVVLAQGADDPVVVERITRAVESLVDVSVHKIQVLKMKES